MEVDRYGVYKLVYCNGKYKVREFLLGTAEWYEFYGEANKNEAVLFYLYLIEQKYGYEIRTYVSQSITIKNLFL